MIGNFKIYLHLKKFILLQEEKIIFDNMISIIRITDQSDDPSLF